MAGPALPTETYSAWGTRVLALLIDGIPVLILEGIGWGLLLGTGILAFIYWIWNRGYRQGTTGSSVGKSIMKFKIINEKTGQPVGFGMSLVRELFYGMAAGFCFGILWLIAVLFPLWDVKRQTLVDKMLGHAALPIESNGE